MRYIDADALIEKIFPYDVVDKKSYAINAKAVHEAIKNVPTANVVPKSKVEQLKAMYEDMETQRAYTINMLGERLEQQKTEVERWRRNLEAVLEERAEEKSEVAREIFEEIEKLLKSQEAITENQRLKEVADWIFQDYLPKQVAELKKKYTEEKKDED